MNSDQWWWLLCMRLTVRIQYWASPTQIRIMAARRLTHEDHLVCGRYAGISTHLSKKACRKSPKPGGDSPSYRLQALIRSQCFLMGFNRASSPADPSWWCLVVGEKSLLLVLLLFCFVRYNNTNRSGVLIHSQVSCFLWYAGTFFNPKIQLKYFVCMRSACLNYMNYVVGRLMHLIWFHSMWLETWCNWRNCYWCRPLIRHVKMQGAHAPGMPGTFSPSPTSTETAS